MSRPVLAFAHANGVPGGSYRTFLEPLYGERDVRVREVIGLDARYPVDAHWHSLALELEQWLEGLPKPLTGVGHSMGGVLMFMVASRRPEWFRSLVMLDPPLINGPMRPLFNLLRRIGQSDRVTPAGRSKGRRAHWPDMDAVQAYFRGRGIFGRFDPRCLQDYLDAALVQAPDGYRLLVPPEVEVAIFRTTPGNLQRFPRLKVPGAIITGADSEGPFHTNHRRHCRRHRMTWAHAPGGHMFPLERPDEAAGLLQSLLAELEHDAAPRTRVMEAMIDGQ